MVWLSDNVFFASYCYERVQPSHNFWKTAEKEFGPTNTMILGYSQVNCFRNKVKLCTPAASAYQVEKKFSSHKRNKLQIRRHHLATMLCFVEVMSEYHPDLQFLTTGQNTNLHITTHSVGSTAEWRTLSDILNQTDISIPLRSTRYDARSALCGRHQLPKWRQWWLVIIIILMSLYWVWTLSTAISSCDWSSHPSYKRIRVWGGMASRPTIR